MNGKRAFVLGAAASASAIFGTALWLHLKKEKRKEALAAELGLLVKAKATASGIDLSPAELQKWGEQAADWLTWKGYKNLGEYPALEADIDRILAKWQAQNIEPQEKTI